MPTVFAGEVWREVDPRFKRWVKVRFVHKGVVIISRCDEKGTLENSMRVTTAKQERFNGKRNGYEYYFSTAL
jgi:hypothetical protein